MVFYSLACRMIFFVLQDGQVYIYIYIYICTYNHIHIHIDIFVYIYMCTYMSGHVGLISSTVQLLTGQSPSLQPSQVFAFNYFSDPDAM